MTWDEAAKLGLALPGVEIGASYGTPALKVAGKLMARLWEDGETLVLKGIGFDQRELLIEVEPDVFFVTDHYLNYDCVLMRLPRAEPAMLQGLLDQIWRAAAPKRMVKAREELKGGGTKQ